MNETQQGLSIYEVLLGQGQVAILGVLRGAATFWAH